MLDRIHKVAEIVASFAIVGSLIFVGVQVSQNTEAVDVQRDDANWSQWITITGMGATSPDLADIIVRGQAGGLDALTEAEQFRFSQYHGALFTAYEKNYRSWMRDPGMADMSSVHWAIANYLNDNPDRANKGSREWWHKSKHRYQLVFIEWAEQVSQ
jgi:hypothetical protein